ncbi:substrate-binding periplasmic protein [Chitinibacter sp. S2-10]|uniref:substrate-binding periplasmic protein n=1 Tax=Chitinibacter sp. S2-10 TaxID=3373597 RepID=UPI003977586A
MRVYRSPFISLLVFLLASTLAQAADWTVLTHSLSDEAQKQGGELRGIPHAGKRAFYLEVSRAVLLELGLPTKIEEVPLARGLYQLQTEPRIAFFNVSRIPEREALMRWVGPISKEKDLFYENPKYPTGIHSLNDARDLPVCVVNRGVSDTQLSKLGFSKLQRNNSYIGCFRMLEAGNVRLLASADKGLEEKIADAGVAPGSVRATPVIISESMGYIALSLDTPESEVKRWNQAFQRVVESGRYLALQKQFAD